jgi:hypothetical protein
MAHASSPRVSTGYRGAQAAAYPRHYQPLAAAFGEVNARKFRGCRPGRYGCRLWLGARIHSRRASIAYVNHHLYTWTPLKRSGSASASAKTSRTPFSGVTPTLIEARVWLSIDPRDEIRQNRRHDSTCCVALGHIS